MLPGLMPGRVGGENKCNTAVASLSQHGWHKRIVGQILLTVRLLSKGLLSLLLLSNVSFFRDQTTQRLFAYSQKPSCLTEPLWKLGGTRSPLVFLNEI